MNFIDIILGALILYGLIKGFLNGLFIEVASLVALIAGIFGAIHFSYVAGNFLTEHVDWNEEYINLAAFAITFIAIIIAVSLIGKLLTKLANIAALGLVNKIMGSVFGALKFIVVLGGLLIFISRLQVNIPIFESAQTEESYLYEPVKDMGNLIFQFILKEESGIPDLQEIPETL
ncbi:CvpA family protein [Robertkochia sediminum]|uniref:CvpA family protein n=1 Tax=Robertkochia sediminum TaxID=2785326 RepID=UPI001931895C|nr:CvpA family protein [Robertkochia sediminum]MBL7471903.1 CvpA family protein [Robertkochia sediminum]